MDYLAGNVQLVIAIFGYFTHLITIICMIEAISASCIRLFGRLSDLGVF